MMKRYLLLLTIPTAALALERTASGPVGLSGANSVRLNLPVCHPSQALTVRNGGLACMNVQPNIVLIGSCNTTKTSTWGWDYNAEVLCPVGYQVMGCHGGSRSKSNTEGPGLVEPFTQNDRQGCRASTVNANGASNVQVYAECIGEPGLTHKVEIIAPTGCFQPSGGDGGYYSTADAGEGGDAGGDAGGDGGGGDGGGDGG